MENHEASEKVLFIKNAPTREQKNDTLFNYGVAFNLEEGDPYEHVCQLADGTTVKVDPNSDLTWEEFIKKYPK